MTLEQPDWIKEINSTYTGGTDFLSPQVPAPDTGTGLVSKMPEIKKPKAIEQPDWITEINDFGKPKTATVPEISPIPTVTGIPKRVEQPDWIKEINNTSSVPSALEGFPLSAPPSAAAPTLTGEVGRGIVGGLHDIKSMAGGALAMAGNVVGLPAIESTGKEWMESARKSSEPYTPAVGSFRDVKDVGDAALYLTHGVARMLPNLAATVGLGLISGGVGTALGVSSKIGQVALTMAGGLAGSLPMEVGQIAQQQVDAGQPLDPKKSLWAIPAAVLDVLPQTHAVMRLGVIDRIMGKGGYEISKEVAGKVPGFFSKNIFGRIAKQAGIQFLEEAPTEGAQSILERWGAGNYKFDKEALDDFANSFILGGVTGALFGGAAGILPEGRKGVAERLPSEEAMTGIPTKGLPVEPVKEPMDVGKEWKDFMNRFGVDERNITRQTYEDFFSEAMGVTPQAAYDAASLNSRIEIVPRVGAFKQGILQLVDRETNEPIIDVTSSPKTGKLEVVSAYENGKKIDVEPGRAYPQVFKLFQDMILPSKTGGRVEIITPIKKTIPVPVKVQTKVDVLKPGVVSASQKEELLPSTQKVGTTPGLNIVKEHQLLIDKYGVDEFIRRAGNMEFGDKGFVTATELAEIQAEKEPGFASIESARMKLESRSGRFTVAGYGQTPWSGNEKNIRKNYSVAYENKELPEVWYAWIQGYPGHEVEQKFQHMAPKIVEGDFKIFDEIKATPEVKKEFYAKREEIAERLDRKWGFNKLMPDLAQVLDYQAAKEMGYEGLNNGRAVAMFYDLPENMRPKYPEAGFGRASDVKTGPREVISASGLTTVDPDGTIRFKGVEPRDFPIDGTMWKEFGDDWGADLGILSPFVNVNGNMIPGGLEGRFSYPDLLFLKFMPPAPGKVGIKEHSKLIEKVARSLTPKQNTPIEALNRFIWALTTANTGMLPSQFIATKLKVQNIGDVKKFAAMLPDNPTQEDYERVNQELRKKYSIKKARKNQIEVTTATTVDLSYIPGICKLWLKNPDWFLKKDKETWHTFVDRVATQVRGLGTKTTSLGAVFQDPLHAAFAAVDTHMAAILLRDIAKDKNFQDKFAKGIVDKFNADLARSREIDAMPESLRFSVDWPEFKKEIKNLPPSELATAKTIDDVFKQMDQADIIYKTGDDHTYGKMSDSYVVGVIKKALSPDRTIDLGQAFDLAATKFITTIESGKGKVMSSTYSAALAALHGYSVDNGIAHLALFPQQWTAWEVQRGLFDPHEHLYPDFYKLPHMGPLQLRNAWDVNRELGYNLGTREDFVVGLQNLPSMQHMKFNPSSIGYFRKNAGREKSRFLQFQNVADYTVNANKEFNTNLVEFYPVDDMGKLAAYAKDTFGVVIPADRNWGGYTIKDKNGKWHVFLIRSGLTGYNNMVTTAWHEADGHVGVELLLGKKGDAFFDRVFEYFLKHDPQSLADLSESYKVSPESLEGRRRIARERFAFFSETHPTHNLVNQFIAMVRQFIRMVFPGLQLSDSEIIAVAMKSREIVTSNSELASLKTPFLYRAYTTPFSKPLSEIVVSRSFQGSEKSQLIGPNDIQYVSRDQVAGDSGRIIVTVLDNGFVLKQLEVDPGYIKSGVAEGLILNAVREHGPLIDITDMSPKNRGSIASVIMGHPEIYRDTKVSMATRGFPRAVKTRVVDGADVTMPIYNYIMHDAVVGKVYRAETGYTHPPGTTAADVIKYEQDELGNNLGISPETIQELSQYPASNIEWVTRTKREGKRYGFPIAKELTAGSKILATDGEGGYLVLKGKPGNVWVRQSPEKSNANRTLMVQISTHLINKTVDPESKLYYDSLYENGLRPYDRLYDFWEIPQWIAMASKSLPNADVYVVRDINEAVKFLNSAKYQNVALSVLDVNKDIIHQIASQYKGRISVGGYTDIASIFKDTPNVKTYELMKNFIEDSGVPFVEGTDYRHFEGAEVIPRLNLSDGCLHKCTFCAVVPHGKVKQYSETSVRNQVESIKRLNARLAYINDKTFGQAENSKQLGDIYKELKAANPRFEGFIIQTTAAQMRTFSPDFLRDSGIKYVELGVESYNDAILKKYKKPATEKVIDQAVQKVREANLNLIPNIIIGMPEETAQTYSKTLDFLRRNADIISHTNDYNLAVYKGTDLADTIGPVTPTDMDENAAAKSYHENPDLHIAFSKELFNFSLNQLNTYVPKGSPTLPQTFTTYIDPELAHDVIVAARKLGISPDKLEYIGKQEFPTHYFHLWNVNDPGNSIDGSARAGDNYPMKNDNLGMPRVVMPDQEGAIPGATPSDESETENHGNWGLWTEARKGKDKNFGTKMSKDMGIHEYIYQLPHWVAMKFKEFAAVVKVEWARMDKMNRDRLELTSDATSTADNRVDNQFTTMKDVKSIEPLIVFSDAENIYLQENDLQSKAQELLGRRLTDEEVRGYNSWWSGFNKAKDYIKQKATSILDARMEADITPQGIRVGHMVLESIKGNTENQFANLSEPDQKHFKDLLEEYKSHTEKIRSLSEKLDAINFYMPRIREKGDYVVRVYSRTEDGQTRTAFADRRASPTEAEKLRIQLSEDPRFQGLEIIKTKETVSPEFLFEGLNQARMEAFLGRAVDRAVRKEGLSAKEAQSVMDSIYDSVTNEILARGFRERFMGRSKEGLIEGYKTTDLKSVFMTYMTGLAGSMNKLEATFQFHDALKGIDKNQQKNLFEYASRYITDMLRNSDQVTQMVNKAKTIPYAWYLSANIRMVVAQLFQNYIQGSSVMARYAKELPVAQGGKSGILRTEKAMRDVILGNLTDVEKVWMKEAFTEGETMAKMINEMKGRAESGWASKLTKVIDVLSLPFSKMETINRQTAILAMFRLGQDQGLNEHASYERAKQFVRDVHYAYGKSNMPQLLRDGTTFAQIGGGAYTFRSFTHNFILSMVHYARDANGKLALDVIGRTLAWTVLLGGMGAAPFLDEILDALERLTGVPYRSKMRSALKGAGGDVLAQAGMSGLPTILGVDMSGTLKITPSIPLLGSGNSGSLWGVWGGLGQKGLDAVNFTADGNWARAIESASPTGIEALGKALRGYTEGVRGKGNKPVVNEIGQPVLFTGGEALRQAAGFRPSRTAALSSERRVESNVEKYFTDKRQGIYADARVAKTTSDWEKISRDVTSFNMKAAQYRGVISTISSHSLRESLKVNRKFQKYEQSIESGT